MEKKIRLLRADEIEVRVGAVRPKGITLLLYKDARVDQNILDETFGIYGWKREHQILNGQVFCTVSVRDENGEWIAKQDVGVESYAEPVKGAASDSFKRACFNIGIGRELYTAPFIWIPAEKVNAQKQDGRTQIKDYFHVSSISYQEEGRLITSLVIKNQRDEIVYQINMGKQYDLKEETPKQPVGRAKDRSSGKTAITKAQMAALRKEMERTGVTEFHILQRYNIPALTALDNGLYQKAMEALRKTESAA